jgi:hypothetical protein
MSSPSASKIVTVQFTRLEIKYDEDPGFIAGAGEIYMRYWINNGNVNVVQGTLPGVQPNGEPLTWELGDGDATNDLGGPHARFVTNTSQITVQVQVWDDDDTLTLADDQLSSDLNATFLQGDNYGAGQQAWDTNDYRLFYVITSVDA